MSLRIERRASSNLLKYSCAVLVLEGVGLGVWPGTGGAAVVVLVSEPFDRLALISGQDRKWEESVW